MQHFAFAALVKDSEIWFQFTKEKSFQHLADFATLPQTGYSITINQTQVRIYSFYFSKLVFHSTPPTKQRHNAQFWKFCEFKNNFKTNSSSGAATPSKQPCRSRSIRTRQGSEQLENSFQFQFVSSVFDDSHWNLSASASASMRDDSFLLNGMTRQPPLFGKHNPPFTFLENMATPL